MITFSEIETTTKRASKAAGFSWGVAEEIGKSIIKASRMAINKINYPNLEIIPKDTGSNPNSPANNYQGAAQYPIESVTVTDGGTGYVGQPLIEQ